MELQRTFSEDDVIRAQIISDTMWCARYFFKARFHRKFVPNWHHAVICAHLDLVFEGKIKKLAIRMPPRYGKTELAVKNFVAKGLAINPASKFIHLSYSGDLALDNSEEIRDFVTEDEYMRLFPFVRLSKDSKAKHKWYTTAGGGVYATSTGGQITGFGAGAVDEEPEDEEQEEIPDADFPEDVTDTGIKFAGAIVIDDALKPDDAESDTRRDRINHRWDSTIKSRANSRNTPIIAIGQALHEDDFIGYLLRTEPGEWTVLTLPAISTRAELIAFDKLMRDRGINVEIPIPDSQDENEEFAMWSFKQTIAELRKLREAEPRVFDAQYQQNPKDELGKLLPLSALKFTPDQADDGWVATHAIVDPADGGADWLSVIFVKIYFRNKRFTARVVDVVHTQVGVEGAFMEIDEKLIRYKCEKIFGESNGVGRAFFVYARLMMKAQCQLNPYPEDMNKEAKIQSYYEFVGSHFEFIESYKEDRQYKMFIDHVTRYSREGTNTHKKDAIDVLCSAAKIFKVMYKHLIFMPSDTK